MTSGTIRILLAAAAMASVSASAHAQGPTAPIDQVIAAERAFAADTRERGIKPGFLATVAPGGIVLAPGPVNARDQFAGLPDGPPRRPGLFWWPDFAGVSASGDLGFTSGGANIPVRYFTVWQRQADGTWRWIYDGGPQLGALLPGDEHGAVVRLAPAGAAAGSAEAALAELAPIEAELAARAAEDFGAALAPRLAAEALVGGSSVATFAGRDHEAELARRPARLELRPIGGTASTAGDLAFTYGEARWRHGDAAHWGHYARIWRKGGEGWRLVADLLLPAPGAPPANK
jgi:ketosteroid isomerase-like protein